jgi:hypothetical protein
MNLNLEGAINKAFILAPPLAENVSRYGYFVNVMVLY